MFSNFFLSFTGYLKICCDNMRGNSCLYGRPLQFILVLQHPFQGGNPGGRAWNQHICRKILQRVSRDRFGQIKSLSKYMKVLLEIQAVIIGGY